eukprot:6205806-Pleurochrysis_carterae.AAC.4
MLIRASRTPRSDSSNQAPDLQINQQIMQEVDLEPVRLHRARRQAAALPRRDKSEVMTADLAEMVEARDARTFDDATSPASSDIPKRGRA